LVSGGLTLPGPSVDSRCVTGLQTLRACQKHKDGNSQNLSYARMHYAALIKKSGVEGFRVEGFRVEGR
jgi:hypothetical protein